MAFGNGFWNAYPGTDLHEIDLHYVLMQLLKLRKDMQVVIDSQAITFADPITWNITSQYPAYTVVLDDAGNGYLSRQAVPAGIPLSNTTYWTQIFNFNDIADRIRASIALNAGTSATTPEALTKDDLVWWRGDIYIALTDMAAGTAFIEGTNVQRYTVDEKFGLYNSMIAQLREDLQQEVQDRTEAVDAEEQARIAADAALQSAISELSSESAYYAVNNVAEMLALEDVKAGAIISTRGYYTPDDGGAGHYFVTETGTIDNKLSYGVAGKVVSLIHADGEIVLNQIGAHGDGATDDADLINWALQNFQTVHGTPGADYIISKTIYVPYGKSFDGHTCKIRTAQDFAAHGVANIERQKIAVWILGREPVAGSELAACTKFIRNVQIIESNVDDGGVATPDSAALYLGYKIALTGNASKVNYSVYGYILENITTIGFRNGIYMSEVWETKLNRLSIRDFNGEGICAHGQSVNIYVTNCTIDGRTVANTVGYELNVNPNYSNRPEGHMLTGCGIFACIYGVRQYSALSTQLANCMIDLHESSAIQLVIGDMLISNSWLSSKTGADAYQISNSTVRLDSVGTVSSGNKMTLSGCHIVCRNDNSGSNPGAVMQGQNRYADIVTGCACEGSVRQLFGGAALRIINNSFLTGDTAYVAGNGVKSGNYDSTTGAEV